VRKQTRRVSWRIVGVSALPGLAVLWSCVPADEPRIGGTGSGGTADASMSSGAGGLAQGGAPGGGGGRIGSGGAIVPGSGGEVGSGGAPGSGGSGTGGGGAGTGGSAGRGGTSGTGGMSGSGGVRGTGGGSGGRGGAVGSGGVTADAGTDGSTTPAAVVFSRNVRLNDDTGSGRQTEVALAVGPNGLVLAGWMDERATRVCAFSFSTDGGLTWSRNVSIPNMSGMFVGDPAVAIDGGGTMYAVCQEYLNVGTTGNVRMMTSTDRGASWSAVRTIQAAPDKPWAAGGTTDGVVFVSWLGNAAGIKRSLDHGMTWGPTQSLGNIIHGTGISTSTAGLVHVPYNLDSNRNQLRYIRSRDNGATWDAARDLIPDMGTFCFSCNPRQHPIVGSANDPTGQFVAITWASRMPGGQADDDVWLLYSRDGGTTWTAPIRVNDNTNASRQIESWVAVDAYGRVHLAWTDLRNGQNETFYARSADPTRGFEPNLQVTDGRGTANTDFLGDYKGIAVQGPDVLVVWQDTRRDSGDIFFSRAAGAAGP
jgi:hypothetical protein